MAERAASPSSSPRAAPASSDGTGSGSETGPLRDGAVSSSSSLGTAPGHELSWKKWAGRRGGDQAYKFGDLSRGVLSNMQGAIREIKHHVGEQALDFKEKQEQKFAEFSATLVERGASSREEVPRERSAASVDQAGGPERGASHANAAERWWCLACQQAHRSHRGSKEQRDQPANAIGSLEVRILSLDNPNHPGGEAAVDPVCQLALEGTVTGALAPEFDVPQDEEDVLESSARFYFQELVDSDLQVHVWDRNSQMFNMGFEDQAFCGGAFVPLLALVRHGSETAMDQLRSCSFEVGLKVQLIPLKLIRAKRKLEPVEVSGAKRPKSQMGTVVLQCKLVLNDAPARLVFSEPFNHPAWPGVSAASAIGAARIADPMGTLKCMGLVIGRTGRAVNAAPWSDAFDGLREAPATSVGLQLWWAYLALSAPLWAWPLLLVAVLPVLSFHLRASVTKFAETECFYTMYSDEDDWNINIEKAQQAATEAMKGALKVQQGLLSVAEKLAAFAQKVEKVKYVLTLGDQGTSCICGVILLVAAVAAGVAIELLLVLTRLGLLRPLVVWPPGACALLPGALRESILGAVSHLRERCEALLGDKLRRRLVCFWQRLPDAPEVCHLQLCERYVYSPVPSSGEDPGGPARAGARTL